MATQTSLFASSKSSDQAEKTPAEKNSAVWLLITNQRNLLYMLAAGLIMSPKGFGNKYYADSLNNHPGWIPLFADTIPVAAIEDAVSEATHLTPCAVSITLSSLRGKVKAMYPDGCATVDFPDELTGNEQILFIPAPLPVTWIKSIFFQSMDDKSSCEADALDFANVPLADFSRRVRKQLFSSTFSGKQNPSWPVSDAQLPNQDLPMSGCFAHGAMMAMLLKMANLGDTGIKISTITFADEKTSKNNANPAKTIKTIKAITDPMLSGLTGWQQAGKTPDNASDVLQKLFWGAVDQLVCNHSSPAPGNSLGIMVEYLRTAARTMEPGFQQPLLKLAEDLKKVAGFGDSTITELFERHPKSFSRVMTIFFLRENCSELLDFKHPLLTIQDYLAAAILFAARDGWIALPLAMRTYPGLQEAVTHRMAAMAHRMNNTKIYLGAPPPRPESLRELFTPGIRGWNKSQREAALALTRAANWNGIQTRVTLGTGQYRLEVNGRGMHILVDGEAKAVQTEVDTNCFFSNLATEQMSSSQELKIHSLLKG